MVVWTWAARSIAEQWCAAVSKQLPIVSARGWRAAALGLSAGEAAARAVGGVGGRQTSQGCAPWPLRATAMAWMVSGICAPTATTYMPITAAEMLSSSPHRVITAESTAESTVSHANARRSVRT